MKKKIMSLLAVLMVCTLTACGSEDGKDSEGAGSAEESSTLVYASADYTRINPAMDEQARLIPLLFNGLTAHDSG